MELCGKTFVTHPPKSPSLSLVEFMYLHSFFRVLELFTQPIMRLFELPDTVSNRYRFTHAFFVTKIPFNTFVHQKKKKNLPPNQVVPPCIRQTSAPFISLRIAGEDAHKSPDGVSVSLGDPSNIPMVRPLT